MDISTYIESSNRAGSTGQLFELLVQAGSEVGFDQIAYGALNYRESPTLIDRQHQDTNTGRGGVDPAGPAIALNYPADWCSRYLERRWDKIDPVVAYTPHYAGPYRWEDLAKRYPLAADQHKLMHEARDAGLKGGVSVPLHGPCGRVAVVSFASRFDDAYGAERLGHLNALAVQFHLAFGEMVQRRGRNADLVHLSVREKECLTWTAHGKSSWDIGMILGISENTINFHLKNAMRKLDTTSRTVAVVKAIRLNLVELPML